MGEAKRRKLKDPNFGKPNFGKPIREAKTGKSKDKFFEKPSDPFFLLPREKQKEKAKSWSEEANRILPTTFKPDYGHWYLQNFGCKPITMLISPPYVINPDRMGKILTVSSGDHCISILLNNDQYKENVKGRERLPLSIELQVMPKYRFKTKQTNEFVIPFVVVNFP